MLTCYSTKKTTQRSEICPFIICQNISVPSISTISENFQANSKILVLKIKRIQRNTSATHKSFNILKLNLKSAQEMYLSKSWFTISPDFKISRPLPAHGLRSWSRIMGCPALACKLYYYFHFHLNNKRNNWMSSFNFNLLINNK